MEVLKVMGIIYEQGKLTLDQPLITDKNSRVEVTVLIPEETDQDSTSQSEVLSDFRQTWHEAIIG